MEVKFCKDIADEKLKYAVIIACFQNKYIWVRHKLRITWEIPGGKREPNESILACAKRELYEETGAHSFTIQPVCVYNVIREEGDESYGMLYVAQIDKLINLPESEIAEIQLFSTLPNTLTYPDIQPYLMSYYLNTQL